MCQSHVRRYGGCQGVEGGGRAEPRAACKIVLYCTAIKINVTRNEFPTLYEMHANSF